jgi:DNA-binding transcriptional LysR family regulator
VQCGTGVAIVPQPSVKNEVALGVLKAMTIMPRRSVALSLFRRRQLQSRRKEAYLAALRETLKD